MASGIFDPSVAEIIADAQTAARQGRTRAVTISGAVRQVAFPFPSPADWRDTWIYFLLLDRFNNPDKPPKGIWNRRFDSRQGGTLSGVRAQLGYLEQLGVKAVWLSPVLKSAKPDFAFNYHGYGAQDFLNLDERLASDGTRDSAERELTALVDEAHARGMHVILDIVLNHTARVFDYVLEDGVVSSFGDWSGW